MHSEESVFDQYRCSDPNVRYLWQRNLSLSCFLCLCSYSKSIRAFATTKSSITIDDIRYSCNESTTKRQAPFVEQIRCGVEKNIVSATCIQLQQTNFRMIYENIYACVRLMTQSPLDLSRVNEITKNKTISLLLFLFKLCFFCLFICIVTELFSRHIVIYYNSRF